MNRPRPNRPCLPPAVRPGPALSPRQTKGLQALDAIGEILRADGVELDDLVARGRAIREELTRERYRL